MAQGRKTGGRKAGTKNKRTLQLEAKAREAAARIDEALGGNAFDGDSHALLMSIYKDVSQPMEMRLDAAKSAIRYEKPALSSVDSKGDKAPTYIAYLPQGTDTAEQWLETFGHLREATKQ